MISVEKTVGQIAAESPASVRVFEKYGIDYCCGGGRPLAEACREKGLAVETVLAELESDRSAGNGAARDWNVAPLSELIDHILTTHHDYLRAELPTVQTRLTKVIEAHGAKYPESLLPLREVFLGLQEELYGHMRKEEMILFPVIMEMEAAIAGGGRPAPPPFGTVENPIRVMRHEHDSAATALREMRRLTNGYTLPADACATYRALFLGLQELEADLHQHIHLENNILFPRAAELER